MAENAPLQRAGDSNTVPFQKGSLHWQTFAPTVQPRWQAWYKPNPHDALFPHPLKNPPLAIAVTALGDSVGVFAVEAAEIAAGPTLLSPTLPRTGGVPAPP